MQNFTPLSSALGGALIGSAAALMLVGLGRIAGVSGVFGGLLLPKYGDVAWRVAFVLGLVIGGALMSQLDPALFAVRIDRGWASIAWCS